jgi:hypothetical protein
VRKACSNGILILLILGGASSCSSDIPLPKPPPLRLRRESDDWVKPGKRVELRGVAFKLGKDRMRVLNAEAFDLTLLDDIWLTLSAPNVDVKPGGPYIGDGRDGWYVYLRCPAPSSVLAGSEIEIAYDACSATTYEPGPGNRVIGFRLTAREGHRETHIEGGGEIARRR